jgi:DNA-binding transcriptional MocR family regulator
LSNLVHKGITGTSAVKIAQQIEVAIRAGELAPGDRLPAVRELAGELGVSPATVASAYQALQARAVVVSHKRRGTRITHRPMAVARRRQSLPKGAIDLSDGNPDPALLPSFNQLLRRLNYTPRLYDGQYMHEGLIKLMRREMKADGVNVGQLAVVNGTMDGIDRLITEHLRPGDRVAVEDPGFTGHHDLIASRGLTLVPVRVDDEGMMPDSLERACVEGVQAVLITVRAQSPTGAAITPQRACELRRILQRRSPPELPGVLVIEDDHASYLCESTPCACVHNAAEDGTRARRHEGTKGIRAARSAAAHSVPSYLRAFVPQSRWAYFRSLSKSFNPDLRLAVMTGDDHTMTTLLDRLIVVERWVSHLLQSIAFELLSDKTPGGVRAQVQRAGRIYDERRETLKTLLENAGLKPTPGGRSGYNLWLPVQEETSTVQGLAARGWAVAAGERFRLNSPPGIRITASCLEERDAKRFVADVTKILSPQGRALAH